MKILFSDIHTFWITQNRKFPLTTAIALFALWIVFVEINRIILIPLNLDVPEWLFPISLIYDTGIHITGLIYLVLFTTTLLVLLWKDHYQNEILLFAGCGFLIVFGSLMQGSFDAAFLQPFYKSDIQYYHDALQVPNNWLVWLGEFNVNQPMLGVHARTHPPFAILIHNLFLSLSGNRLPVLAWGFSLISMATIPILWLVLRVSNVQSHKRNLLLLLFAVIPAVNIYSIVSLDGVIMFTSTLFLLGLVMLNKTSEKKTTGFWVMAFGFILTNLLSFGGVFLIGLGLMVGGYDYIKNRGTLILKVLMPCLLLFLAVIYLMKVGFHYDHLQSFLTASKIENPEGYRLISDPANFLITRFEDAFEIALFLSFGVLAVLFSSRLLAFPKRSRKNWETLVVPISGTLILSIMFLSGAYKTGETARACLFIYPILMLALINSDETKLKGMILLAAVQTAIMQISAGFFW